MRSALLGVSAVALLAGAAQAQTAPNTGPVAAAQLEEIIVTAEKRESSVQRTAIAITAVSGEEIANQSRTSLDEVLRAAPAVQIQSTGSGPGIFVRGVGTNDLGFGDSSVNFNIDGVYQQDPTPALAGIFDIARVEVLRGPQGTLYGRNATAGSLNVITNNPDPSGFSASLGVGVGNYQRVRTDAMINAPMGERAAVRLALFTDNHDGYIKPSGNNDADQVGGRLKALFDLSETARLVLSASVIEEKGSAAGSVAASATAAPLDSRPDPWYDPTSVRGRTDHMFLTFAAQLDWDLGFATLTAIPSYVDADKHDLTSSATTGVVNQPERTTQRSLETRLASNGQGDFSWVAGLIYVDGDYERHNPNLNSSGRRLDQTQPLTSYGVFGQATQRLSDTLRLTVGARFSSDEKSQTSIYTTTATGLVTTSPVSSKSWSSVDYRLNLEADLTPRSLLYATLSTGYKAGGFQTIVAAGTASKAYAPEKLRAAEIGSKNRFFDNRLQVNASAYYYDYKDYQAKFPEFVGRELAVRVENAGKATLFGVELESSLQATPTDRLDAYVTWSNSEFDQFTYTSRTPAGATLVDKAGEAMPNAPDLTARLAYEHRWDVRSGAVTARLESAYSNGFWTTHERSIDSFQPHYVRSDASLRYQNDASDWSVRLYVKNIENIVVRAGAASGNSLQAPRTYGVYVEKKF